MKSKNLGKSLRLLALLAITSISHEAAAVSLVADNGTDYTGAVDCAPRNATISMVASGAAVPSGTWTIDGEGSFYMVASGATASANTVTHSGTFNVANKAKIHLQGNNTIDLSGATLTGPSAVGSAVNVILLNSPAGFSAASGTSQKTILPAASALSGNWIFESLNDESAIDTSSTSTTMPTFTVKATKSCYFGGIRGLSGTNSYATTFGGSSSAVVTGPGTLKLGSAFTTFNPSYNKFTGTLETNSAVTLGSSSYPVALKDNTLVVNSAHTVILGSDKPSIKKVCSGNASAVLSAVAGATVAIAELDLTSYGITLTGAGGIVTYNIAKISDGSDQPLTLSNTAGRVLYVNIKAGRTDGGIVKSGTGSSAINIVTP